LKVAAIAAGAGAQICGAKPVIATPPRAVLERAVRSIHDPQLAAEVRPGRRYGAADCVVLLALYRPHANAAQRKAIDRAKKAWRAAVVRELGETDAEQMIGSSVNPLVPTPLPLRQAAAAWCAAHAPKA
jgi:hypothetical protein